MKVLPLSLMASSALMLCAAPLLAANHSWIGPGTGGAWETAENWSGGLPGTEDRAILGNVTSGTREVILGSDQQIQFLEMSQTTAGAINRLVLNANLNLTAPSGSGNTLFDIQGGTEIKINAGYALVATKTSGSIPNNVIKADLTLDTGAALRAIASNGTSAITIEGDFDSNGGTVLVKGNAAALTLKGASALVNNSILRMEVSDNAAAGFTNQGTLTMDQSHVQLHWDANPAGVVNRRFVNTGDWTLSHGSTVTFSTVNSTGQNNLNDTGATLRIESGSSVTIRTMINNGTLILGSSADGLASDARVVLGTDAFLHPKSLDNSGSVLVRGDALFGEVDPVSSTRTVTFSNLAGGLLEIGGGETPVPLAFTLRASGNVAVTNADRLILHDNATLSLQAAIPHDTAASTATLVNSGTFVHAGRLEFQTNAGSGTRSLTSSGTYRISGVDAEIVALPNSKTTGTVPRIGFTVTGSLTGDSSHDRLTYINTAPSGASAFQTITVDGGIVSPGSATENGLLEFSLVNLTLQNSARLELDIAGSADGNGFDRLLLNGTDGGKLTLGLGSVLNIRLGSDVETFTPYTLISANEIEGTFSTLLFNGVAAGNAYFLTYEGNAVTLTFTVVPEPSTFALLGAAALALGLWRRRGIA